MFTAQSVERMTTEWMAVIERDDNHPCTMAWVPTNESWGVPELRDDSRQRAHLATMYYLTKSLDPSRLVISNDGWEHAISDLLTIHDVVEAIGTSSALSGFGYTQFTAVDQEINGLLTYERQPKVSMDAVRKIIASIGEEGSAMTRESYKELACPKTMLVDDGTIGLLQ